MPFRRNAHGIDLTCQMEKKKSSLGQESGREFGAWFICCAVAMKQLTLRSFPLPILISLPPPGPHFQSFSSLLALSTAELISRLFLLVLWIPSPSPASTPCFDSSSIVLCAAWSWWFGIDEAISVQPHPGRSFLVHANKQNEQMKIKANTLIDKKTATATATVMMMVMVIAARTATLQP